MVEPISASVAAAGASAGGAGAVSSAAGSGATASATAGSGTLSTAGASAGLSPAFAEKAGLLADSIATPSPAGLDPGAFKCVVECHQPMANPSQMPAPSSLPGEVNSEVFLNPNFLHKMPHEASGNTLNFEFTDKPTGIKLEVPREPVEAIRESSPTVRTQTTVKQAPEKRDPFQPPELTPGDRSQAPKPTEQPSVEETPLPERTPENWVEQEKSSEDTSSPSNSTFFSDEVDAFNLGYISTLINNALKGLLDLSTDIYYMGMSEEMKLKYGYEDINRSSEQLTELSDAAMLSAQNKNELAATLGGLTAVLAGELEPSSKGRAVGKGTRTVLKAGAIAAAAQVAKKAKKSARKKLKKKALSLGRRVKRVESTKSFRSLKSKGLISKKKVGKPKRGRKTSWDEGIRYQRQISGGKDHEYVGKLKDTRGVSKNTVQIDDLRVTNDGRLVLVESKLGSADIDQSGHLIEPSSKLDLIKRYLKFTKENPEAVSHIEIECNNGATAEVYKNIVEQNIGAKALKMIEFIVTKKR